MANTNPNFSNVAQSYFFSDIAKRVKVFSDANPKVELYKLGIGNTTEAIVPAVIEGLERGVSKLSARETYTGYGDEQGDTRLRQAVAQQYAQRGITFDLTEIFISDGAKTDCANITSIFSGDSIVAVTDPVYPVYRDAALMTGKKVVYMPATEEHNFFPNLPIEHVDIIYLCSPNNPTGMVASAKQLKSFVDYAIAHRSVIVFDAAYAEFITDPSLPKSIYAVEGAKRCAIEIQSFSKSAGFTGVRLGWTVVPKELVVEGTSAGAVHTLWNRRQTTMFNGASNIAQEGGLAALSPEGQKQTRAQVGYYMENARIIREGARKAGFTVFGGDHAPYIWLKCPRDMTSWDLFDKILAKAHVITTPGTGFGALGEGYLRLSAFGSRAMVEEAVKSIQEHFTKTS